MKKDVIKFFKHCLPSSLLSILMLFSCATPNANNSSNDDSNVTRVDFNEMLKKVNIGFENNFNDSVKVSSAVSNAKVKNQEITVIIEMDGKTTVDSYLNNSNKYDSYPEFYNSKEAIKQENAMVTKQSDLASKLLKEGLISEVYGNYSTLINGFYAKTTYGKIEQIREFKNVKAAYVSTQFNKPTSHNIASTQTLSADSGVINNETNVDPATGIYVNETQYDGTNTIVAVLDSGFDYTHEVFKMDLDDSKLAITKDKVSSLLPSTMAYQFAKENLSVDDVYLSDKVPFAYDYADKKVDVFPVESDHGTHVSGIIGGESDKIQGIAPNTQFAWMKVFSDDTGGGDNADIISALEDSVILGVDAINLSLGAVGGYSAEVIPAGEVNSIEERTNKVYEAIENVGISLLTAAGNEYSSGYQSATGTNLTSNPESGTISSPGSYPASLTVASINGTLDPYALINGSNSDAVFFRNVFDSRQVEHKFIEELFAKINELNLPRNEDGTITLEYVTVPGNGTKANYTGLNVKGKIALIKRGNISFEEKLTYAYGAGAIAALIYNNVSGSLAMTVGENVYIPIAGISLEAGSKLAERKKGTLTFKEDYASGPFMSDFSSWGPLADLTLKPEITAHGGNIYSSILGGGYDQMSGTSMATPNTCGIVLVIRDYVKETWPNLSPKEVTQMVNRLLMSTATICLNEIGNPYSVRKQGAGLASLTNSISTNAYLYVEGIDKPKLELGDDKNKSGKYVAKFNIKNISDHEITYDIGNFTMTETVSSDKKSIAETAYMLNPDMDVKVGDGLTISGNTITVPAGVDSTITVTLSLNAKDKKYLDDNFKNGMYVEGFVALDAKNSAEIDLNIPFLAFYGDWLAAPMFDVTYYDVEADRVNESISEKDKTVAAMTATTPYGKYGDYYMIPLGGYLYEIDPQYEQIAATTEKAAISIDSETAIYQLYTIYVGMLRGAKKLTMTITNASSGEVIYEKVTYNNRKASFYGSYGGILPYNEDYDFDMFNEDTGEVFANNTKFVVDMKAELDYENGDQVSNNTFSFEFYVDYETPTLEDVRYITEWDKATKKYKYYMELDVSDNRFAQAIRPCTIVNNSLISLTDNPIPIYQQYANEKSTTKIEITDFIPLLKNSEYPDTIFFMIDDYAMNSNIFMVSLAGCDDKNLAFNESQIEINKNEIVNLNDYVNVENAVLQGLTWTSSNEEIAIVDEAQVIGLKKGMAYITGTSSTYETSIKIRVKVIDNNNENNVDITKISFNKYQTLFSFSDDFEYSSLGRVDDEGVAYSYMPSTNSFEIYPSESFKLEVAIAPWYYDDSKVTIKWSSSNSNYVTVDENGVVTAVKETISPVSIKAVAYVNGVETVFSTSTTVVVKDPFVVSGSVLQYYKGAGGVVEIPDDLGIEYIGEYAFSHYRYNGFDMDGYAYREPIGDNTKDPITKIIIPNGVKFIQNYAFAKLTYVEEIVTPDTLTDIYVGAFEGCTSLTKINLNSVVKIQANAFNGDIKLANVNKDGATIGNDLSHIVTMGDNAFKDTAITKADLVKLRMAGNNVFQGCTSLKEVTLYDENPLKENMFESAAIENITIPHSYIPTNAFVNCSSIKTVTFTNAIVNIAYNAFANCTTLETINFANNCTSLTIGYEAFKGSNIETLNLPNCDVILSDLSFQDSSIKTLTIGEKSSITFEGTPFVNTQSFDQIVLDANNANYELENGLLLNETKDTIILVPSNVSLVIPNSVKVIGEGAVAGNKVTKSLTLPSTITKVCDYAFSSSSLEEVDFINASNIEFGTYTFYDCKELKTIKNLENIGSIKDYMFAYSGITSLQFDGEIEIGYGAFAFCEQLDTVVFNEKASIGDYAFYKSFGKDVTEGENQITYKSEVVMKKDGNIGEYAFAESNIKSIKADEFTNIISEGAFMFTTSLVDASFAKATEVGRSAFANSPKHESALTSINIPSVTHIANGAFRMNTNLSTVNANSLVSIGDYAFANCKLLSTINLSTVNEINAYAFENCESLTTIDLSSIKEMGEGAFCSAVSLASVDNLEKSELTIIPDNAFAHYSEDGSTSMALESINLSKITSIGDYAFYSNSVLRNVDLSKVETIGDYAFFGTVVNELTLTNAKSVGHFAFYQVPVRNLSMPVLESVGECAFAETWINEVDLPSTLRNISYGSFSSISFVKNYTHNGEVNYTQYDENNNPVWMISEGVLYKYLANGKLQLQSYPVNSDRTSYKVVEGTVRIDAYSFYSSSIKLTEITFPYSLESIGDCAFGGCDSIKDYYFNSYDAPVLEGVYNSALINYIYNLSEAQLTDKVDNLYKINAGKVYNMYFYYYPYYYANFYDYVGFVDGLTIHYPENGKGYDSWIYTNYFDEVKLSAAVADEATNKAMEALDAASNIEKATNENKDEILQHYNSYIVITDESQKALLDADKVNHLVKLYNEVVDLENPVVDNETLSSVIGTFTGVDSDQTTYKLVINEDGSGTIEVDNQTNDNQDKSLTFDKVRRNSEGKLLVITNEGSSFTFEVTGEGTLNFKYYVSDITLSIQNGNDDPITDPIDPEDPVVPEDPVDDKDNSGLWIGLGIGGGVLVIGAILAVVFIFIRKRKTI